MDIECASCRRPSVDGLVFLRATHRRSNEADDRGRARLRPVTVGTLTDFDAEIASGVNPGDDLIVGGVNRRSDDYRA
jgi:hypothetical protein